MRGAGQAIAWDFRRHHRWGFVALGVYLVAFAAVKALFLGPEARMQFNPPNGLAAFVMVPATILFFYFVGAFTYGLAGDLAARESIFPARMFTLPVRTAALAGWPMLYGTVAALVLWFVTVLFARWSGGPEVGLPWVWPGFLMAAWLAWMQAFTWMPYGLRGMRVIVAVLWLIAVDAIVLLAVYSGASEAAMVAFLAPQIPLAYLVACHAVARGRRGEVPDWRMPFARGAASDRGAQRKDFSSAASAQTWFEWRRHGWTLPALVGAVVPFELLLLFIPGHETPGIVFAILFFVVITPPVMAAFAAPALSAFTGYTATRPLTSASLVAAKLKMTSWSAFAAWMIVVVLTAFALALSGSLAVVVERARILGEVAGPVRGIAAALLVFAALVASTWKNLVLSLGIGLTGREWLVKSTVLFVFALIIAAGPLLYALGRSSEARWFLFEHLAWILATLVGLKILAACWIAIGLYDRGVLGDRALVAWAASWLAAVAAFYAFLEWLADAPIFPVYFLGAIAILAVPLVRLSAAPLALAWSRHR